MDATDPLMTIAHTVPGMSADQIQAEVLAMYTRNQAISACTSGNLSPSDLLEVLAAHSVDPDIYLKEAENNLRLLGIYG